MHSDHLKLGLGVQAVADGAGWQGAIEYLDLSSPKRTASMWHQLGVTHVLANPNRGPINLEDVVREVVFQRTINQYGRAAKFEGGWVLNSLASTPRDTHAAAAVTRVAWFGCEQGLASGIYEPLEFARRNPYRVLPADMLPGDRLQALDEVNGVVVEGACTGMSVVTNQLSSEFIRTGTMDRYSLWIRR
jgi:hypothetical protein